MSTQTSPCVFRQLCLCHLEPKMARKPPSFCFGFHFFSIKNLNHIAKNVSIFHLKSGDNYRPNYFSTSTSLRHTSHHHDRPIASGWFLTWRIWPTYTRRSIFDMEKFWQLIWANLMSCTFSFFLFPCTFSKSRVSINKVL